jgi:hypothetical protein
VAPATTRAGEPVAVTITLSGRCTVRGGPLHVVIAVDAWLQPTGDRIERIRNAVTEVVEGLGVSRGGFVRVGMVEYSGEARTVCRMTDRMDRLRDCVDELGMAGGLTRVDLAIERSMLVMIQGRRDFETPAPGREVLILFSDRNQAGCQPVLGAIGQARGQNMRVATVCVARTCDSECLTQVADPNWHYGLEDVSGLESELTQMRGVLLPGKIDLINVTDHLPDGLDPVPLSARPAARQSGREIEWEVRTSAAVTQSTAVTMTFAAVPSVGGRLASSTGDTRVRVAIGRSWFTPTVSFPIPAIDVEAPPTSTVPPTVDGSRTVAHLPRAIRP